MVEWTYMAHLLTGLNNHYCPQMTLMKRKEKLHLILISQPCSPVIPFEQYSDFNHLKHVTAWILRFTKNCRPGTQKRLTPLLSTEELHDAEYYWISIIQNDHFQNEIQTLKQVSIEEIQSFTTTPSLPGFQQIATRWWQTAEFQAFLLEAASPDSTWKTPCNQTNHPL